MIYRYGLRYNLHQLKVVRVSTYVGTYHGDCEVLKWRYAFEQEKTGLRFVYTGTQQNFKEGDVIDLRGTVKKEADRFGMIRLARIRKVDLEKELDL